MNSLIFRIRRWLENLADDWRFARMTDAEQQAALEERVARLMADPRCPYDIKVHLQTIIALTREDLEKRP